MSPIYINGVEQTVAHKASHQDGGADEISVAALSGLLADDQHVLDAEVTAVAIPLAQKAAASGVASLDALSVVVQQPPAIDAAKVTSGRFGVARLPDGTSGYFLKAQGAGNDPVYAAMSLTVTEALAAAISSSSDLNWTTYRTVSIPANAKKVEVWVCCTAGYNATYSYVQALYNGVQKAYATSTEGTTYLGVAHWAGDGVGAAANLEIQLYSGNEAVVAKAGSGAWYVTT